MRCYKGTIVAVRQCGECPGAFAIDNSCFRMIAGWEGIDWIGRLVEYRDAHMRFLDSPEALEDPEFGNHASLPALP